MISVQSPPAAVTITVLDGVGSTSPYQLKPDQTVFLGTSPNCGLPLSGAGVADMHCYLKLEDGKLWIEDWMSKAGTLVNGTAISTRVEIGTGDIIQVGPNRITLQGSAFGAQQVVQAPERVNIISCPESSGDVCPASTTATDDTCYSPGLGSTEPSGHASCGCDAPESVFDSSVFQIEEAETYDGETVALLRAEIEHLQAALARRDAEGFCDPPVDRFAGSSVDEDAGSGLVRIQELIDEANRSDERVAILEEMLHAAEDANRSEQEERKQLEAWVDDIENRVVQRQDEHQAEIALLRHRLEESNQIQARLVQQLRQAANNGSAPKHYEEHLDRLQHSHQKLQDALAESQKQCAALQQRLEQASQEPERALREERAKIAKEHAQVARLRYEVSSKLAAFEDLPKNENLRDTEAAHRIKALREHLREIHEQEKQEEKSASLTTRLSRLWKRVEY